MPLVRITDKMVVDSSEVVAIVVRRKESMLTVYLKDGRAVDQSLDNFPDGLMKQFRYSEPSDFAVTDDLQGGDSPAVRSDGGLAAGAE